MRFVIGETAIDALRRVWHFKRVRCANEVARARIVTGVQREKRVFFGRLLQRAVDRSFGRGNIGISIESLIAAGGRQQRRAIKDDAA
ncbi:hypothetical protein ABWH74_005723 [Burkholderia vietnamiensis]|uniref:hypothetical protein n=1 Tax=Burkholderia vietnamiensis TaxID=60552 RepID=UPI0012D92D61|nr:hypothetical protein [Burkholderia vietnamiensis]MDN7924924.1 hypothetical protein [Burkholderia vietnamiensis]HDR9076626.1 hypothetical protein [Burkholderia vietnamiensis]HDR9249635.1 hypothetical protein [Burkholderia vietnamiensis]